MVNFSSNRCPLTSFQLPGLNQEGLSSFSPAEEMQILQGAGIPYDVFHYYSVRHDNLSFNNIFSCSPAQNALFRNYQTGLDRRLQGMSAEEISRNLESLYRRAFLYNPHTQTLGGENQNAREALGSFINVLGNLAHEDRTFFNKINTDSIHRWMRLASLFLSPEDRNWEWAFFQQRRDLRTYLGEDIGHLLSVLGPNKETAEQLIESHISMRQVIFLHGEQFAHLEQHMPSLGELENLLRPLGLWERFQNLHTLQGPVFSFRYQEIMNLLHRNPSAAEYESLMQERILCLIEMDYRDFDPSLPANIVSMVDARARYNLNDEDRRLFSRILPEGNVNDPLNFENMRYEVLDKFRELYRDFLVRIQSGTLRAEDQIRYGFWSDRLFNPSMSRVFVSNADLANIRHEVQREMNIQSPGPISYEELERRGRSERVFLRPQDLGQSALEPLGRIHQLRVGDQSLAEFLHDNMDWIAVLPSAEMLPHEAGLTYALFGIIFVKSSSDETPWTPSYLLEVLAHEAAHQHYAFSNYDEHPESLTWLGVDERYAYLVGQSISAQEGQNMDRIVNPDLRERTYLLKRMEGVEHVIRSANRRLHLPEEDSLFRERDSRWSSYADNVLSFQPGNNINDDSYEEGVLRNMQDSLAQIRREHHSEEELAQAYQLRIEGNIHSPELNLSEDDQQRVRDSLNTLDHLSAGEISPTFLNVHPLTRFLRHLDRNLPIMLTFNASSWKRERNTLARGQMYLEREAQERVQWVTEHLDLVEEAMVSAFVEDGLVSNLGDNLELRRQIRALNALKDRPTEFVTVPSTSPLGRILNDTSQESYNFRTWSLSIHLLLTQRLNSRHTFCR